ncbi:hypothetical protein BXY66_2105 [Shimia isoporae]|uniref:Lipoprotein n=1 Tax=Shimia isoporae TaxID=647720 RepID=A0A4R1NNL3_9RHOB|nr:hypothetical protein [Shimia isoporae]TCL10037.1 hypothetical protein BXY66_2105 [Shimia isoporae]
MARLLASFVFIVLVACGVPEDAKKPDIPGLEQEILALGDFVSREEAARVARISYEYSLQLRSEYQVSDPPLIHNTKVNQGLRSRGLCWHWADDLESRLRAENLQTLSLHRAIANTDNLRIEHSTVILSERGEPMQSGVVLDPWRYGGYLFWAPMVEDTRYNWKPRSQVFRDRRN